MPRERDRVLEDAHDIEDAPLRLERARARGMLHLLPERVLQSGHGGRERIRCGVGRGDPLETRRADAQVVGARVRRSLLQTQALKTMPLVLQRRCWRRQRGVGNGRRARRGQHLRAAEAAANHTTSERRIERRSAAIAEKYAHVGRKGGAHARSITRAVASPHEEVTRAERDDLLPKEAVHVAMAPLHQASGTRNFPSLATSPATSAMVTRASSSPSRPARG